MPWISSPTDGVETATIVSQLETESLISTALTQHTSSASPSPLLRSSQHLSFLTRILAHPLPVHYTGLDASRPWLLYWVIHSLGLFQGDLDASGKKRVIETLRSCQNPDGGFGGGPGQLSHLAPSYCSVVALAYIGVDGFEMVNRQGMYNFLMSIKQPDGSFIMHEDGEVDVRGCYCALTVATLLNILTPSLARGTSSFIASCQTYEGGLAASSHPFSDSRLANPPLGEAHGGYTFCAIASYSLLRPLDDDNSPCYVPATLSNSTPRTSGLNLASLVRWTASVQGTPIEGGGFRGRTNKLVDGCYSWWGGGLFALISSLMDEEKATNDQKDLYDRSALQEYVLLVAQAQGGGLRDKPGKGPDAYHTCYNLSGYSSAQHKITQSMKDVDQLRQDFSSPFGAKLVEVEEEEKFVTMILDDNETEAMASIRMQEIWARSLAWKEEGKMQLLADDEANEVMPTHPIFNVTPDRVRIMMDYFYSQS